MLNPTVKDVFHNIYEIHSVIKGNLPSKNKPVQLGNFEHATHFISKLDVSKTEWLVLLRSLDYAYPSGNNKGRDNTLKRVSNLACKNFIQFYPVTQPTKTNTNSNMVAAPSPKETIINEPVVAVSAIKHTGIGTGSINSNASFKDVVEKQVKTKIDLGKKHSFKNSLGDVVKISYAGIATGMISDHAKGIVKNKLIKKLAGKYAGIIPNIELLREFAINPTQIVTILGGYAIVAIESRAVDKLTDLVKKKKIKITRKNNTATDNATRSARNTPDNSGNKAAVVTGGTSAGASTVSQAKSPITASTPKTGSQAKSGTEKSVNNNKSGNIENKPVSNTGKTDTGGHKSAANDNKTDTEGHKSAASDNKTDTEGRKSAASDNKTDTEGHKSAANDNKTDTEGHKSVASDNKTDTEGHKSAHDTDEQATNNSDHSTPEEASQKNPTDPATNSKVADLSSHSSNTETVMTAGGGAAAVSATTDPTAISSESALNSPANDIAEMQAGIPDNNSSMSLGADTLTADSTSTIQTNSENAYGDSLNSTSSIPGEISDALNKQINSSANNSSSNMAAADQTGSIEKEFQNSQNTTLNSNGKIPDSSITNASTNSLKLGIGAAASVVAATTSPLNSNSSMNTKTNTSNSELSDSHKKNNSSRNTTPVAVDTAIAASAVLTPASVSQKTKPHNSHNKAKVKSSKNNTRSRYDNPEFEQVVFNTSDKNVCTPAITDQNWTGIKINAPQIIYTNGKNLPIFPVCAVLYLKLVSSVVDDAIIEVINIASHKIYNVKTKIIKLATQTDTGLLKNNISVNLAEQIDFPNNDATYTVRMLFKGSISNTATIQVKSIG